MKQTYRLLGALTAIGLAVSLIMPNPVFSKKDDDHDEKWTICHATESEQNPYTRIVVSSKS